MSLESPPRHESRKTRELYSDGRLTQFGGEIVKLVNDEENGMDGETRRGLLAQLEANRVEPDDASAILEDGEVTEYRSRAAESRRGMRQLLENPTMLQGGTDFEAVLESLDSEVERREATLQQGQGYVATNRLELAAAKATAKLMHEAHARGESLDSAVDFMRRGSSTNDGIANQLEDRAHDEAENV